MAAEQHRDTFIEVRICAQRGAFLKDQYQGGFPFSGLLKNPEPPEELRWILLPAEGSVEKPCRSASERDRRSGEKADKLLSGFSFRFASLGTRPTKNVSLQSFSTLPEAGSVTRRPRKWLRAGHNHDFVAVKTCPNTTRLPEPHNPNQDLLNSPFGGNDDERALRMSFLSRIRCGVDSSPNPVSSSVLCALNEAATPILQRCLSNGAA
jgi:hypothetical protein